MNDLNKIWNDGQLLQNQYDQINQINIHSIPADFNNPKKEILLANAINIAFPSDLGIIDYTFNNIQEEQLLNIRPIFIFTTEDGYSFHSYDNLSSSFIWKHLGGNTYKIIINVSGYLSEGPPHFNSTDWPLYLTCKLIYLNIKQFNNLQQNKR